MLFYAKMSDFNLKFFCNIYYVVDAEKIKKYKK